MTYIVKSGDTLSGIAQRFETTVEALVASNGIKNKNLIYTGQVLNVPGTHSATWPANPDPEPDTGSAEVVGAIKSCINVIENLPEFKKLEELLNG